MKLNVKKTENAWSMFDWANSVYNLVITSTIFPLYYNSVTETNGSDMVDFFGITIKNTVLYSYAISFSFFIIMILSPMLSGIADYGGKKKTFMKFFTYMGSLACIGMFFFDSTNVEYGIICALFASMGYSGGLVFYNAYLPEIVSKDRYDKVSAKGFSYGYVGSVLLLAVNLAMVTFSKEIGFADDGQAVRTAFLMVGLWWLGFAQIPFFKLPDNVFGRKPDYKHLVNKGLKEIVKVFKSLRHLPMIRQYLLAFFFYNAGVQTVMLMAASFGDKELNLPKEALYATILLLQLVGAVGSYFFAYVSRKAGNKTAITIMLLIWIGICIGAYNTHNAIQFYVLAFFVGLVMGGIQSLSRSTYSKLIPNTTIDHASYFSFFDVTEKLSIVIGMFSYGLIEQLTGNMRNSTLILGLFFVVGIVLLSFLKSNKQTWTLEVPDENKLAA